MVAPNVTKQGERMEKYSYENAISNAASHPIISQYTDLCALKKIIGNKCLRFTRVDALNDLIENQNMHDLWKKKVYVSCFTYREYESYFFWSTYCKCKPCGVKISFQANTLQKLSFYPDEKCQEMPLGECQRTIPNSPFSENVSADTWGIYDYSCIDIAYIPRNINVEEIEHFQGRIKYHEWDMECETRLRVAIRPKCFESKLVKTQFHYLRPCNKYLYAKLTPECLETMTITLSPFGNNAGLKEDVEKLLIENGLCGKVKIIGSCLSSELK
jgi:hypothetical protein